MKRKAAAPKGHATVGSTLLGGLTSSEFLRHYWQKKPLFIRGALPNFRDLLSPDELAGLALEANVSARLVTYRKGKKPWRLEHGPFPAERLQRLPKRNFALLVQGVNQHLESAGRLLDQFNFIPSWRLDDLMVSFAPAGGGVGPHVDSYDVFLIQGMGQRRWEIAEKFDPTLISGVDLKILKNFQPEQSWVLEPGDMLYLPPGVAHNGVALSSCMTYSVGFRAPFARTLLGSLLNLPDQFLPPEDALYSDPDLALVANPSEVADDAVHRLRRMLMPLITNDELLGRWLAAAVTSLEVPYAWVPESGQSTMVKITDKARSHILQRFERSREIWRNDACRFAYRLSQDQLFVYLNAEEFALPIATQKFVELLLLQRVHSAKSILAALPRASVAREAALNLLVVLKREGAIYFK